MKSFFTFLTTTFILLHVLSIGGLAQAQTNTYDQVYSIFQAKCASCHNASVNANLSMNFNAPAATLYSQLVNKIPINPAAKARGDKRVDAGYPHRSFLLRKCNNNLDPDNGIYAGEGDVMPPAPAPGLSKQEVELIRQWILKGAPQAGKVVDTAIVNTFYRGKGIGISTPLAPPPPALGSQIHLGRIFLDKKSETEVFIKHDMRLPKDTEIYKLDIQQPPQSHHFVIYKFYQGLDKNFPNGLRDTTIPSHGSADMVSIFSPKTKNITLPPATAFMWEKNSVLDINYHFYNDNADSVLAADIYLNVYTQPKGTAQKIMYTRYFANLTISIPQDTSREYTFTSKAQDSTENNSWMVWRLYSHTHKYGKDYDIYLSNPDGSKGAQQYEGFYDFDYQFNQGFYGWGVEAAQRVIYPFLEVNPHDGFIHEAKFKNHSGPNPVSWGLTAKDEMMAMVMQYTYGNPVGIKENNATNEIMFNSYPNPFSDDTRISYSLTKQSKVVLELYNALGEKVKTFVNEYQPKNSYTYTFKAQEEGLSPGMYLLRITAGEQIFSRVLLKK
jgi:hypothetical protein